MSSLPSPDGATDVIVLVRGIDVANKEIAEVQLLLGRLRGAKERRDSLQRALRKQLEDMDCDSIGNYGWDARFGWLLGEVVRQMTDGAS